MIYYVLMAITFAFISLLISGILNTWIVFWVIGSLVISTITAYYILKTASLGKKISVLILAISLIGGWYIYLPTESGEESKEVAVQEQKMNPVEIIDSLSLKIQTNSLTSLSENLNEEISDPETAARKINIVAQKVATIQEAQDNLNKARDRLSDSNGPRWWRVVTGLAELQFKLPDINVQNWAEYIRQADNATKVLMLGFSLLCLSIFIRKIPKEKRTATGSVGALLVLLAVMMMLWPGISSLPAQAAVGVSQVYKEAGNRHRVATAVQQPQTTASGLEIISNYDDWYVVMDKPLSPTKWTEWFDSKKYAKWRASHGDGVEIEVAGKGIKTNPSRDFNCGPNAKVRFRGSGNIVIKALPW